MKNLPVGIQELSKIIEQDLLYVDKTEYIYQLLTEGTYFFLSRPRRFGKSLLVNTLKEIFLGNKVLFKGLWIEEKIDWKKYPVILIDFSKIGFGEMGLEKALIKRLHEIAEEYQIQLVGEFAGVLFKELITKLAKERQVVVLIDEYDKPIIDYLDNIPQAEEMRNILKKFYSILKGSDIYLRFVFLTGVSKFAKVSIFSDLNNLNDITIDRKFAKLLGYTQQELHFYFEDRINKIQNVLSLSKEELLKQIKIWYNGYSWNGRDFVYNPFSVLNFFSKEDFGNYWFSTGTPTFLTKVLAKDFNYNLQDITADFNSFDTHNLANLDYVALLFQTGYLTIKENLEFGMFALDYPNKEVKDSLMQYLVAEYAHGHGGQMKPLVFKIYKALQIPDIDLFISILQTLFASIPAEIFIAKKEAYYHSIIFLILQLLGFFIQTEVRHSKGRLDAVIIFPDKIFILEFKLDKSAEIALNQIKEKGYEKPYLQAGKEIYLLGINMQSELKSIEDFRVEKI